MDRCWGWGSSGRACPSGSGRREGPDWNLELGGVGHGIEEGTGGDSGSLQGRHPVPLPAPPPPSVGPWPCSWLVWRHLGSEVSSGREGRALALSQEIWVSVSPVPELCGDLVIAPSLL